ncbi:class I SAM-dependent methyltransferase [Sulfurisphaera ohwakuensis]|uniref:class I SAM-dependent methyltransferase n=1 Tax=Sulfurisphaera ohwakuensis TaxID=69656 RepID=UPI0036F442F4
MGALREIFNVDFSNYFKEAEELNTQIEKKLGSSFPYALTSDKRLILYAIVKYMNPNVVIETGVGPGASTTIILSALERGILYSVDIREILENNMPVGFLVPNNLRNKWKLYIGPSREVLPRIFREVNQIDIFFHDSEHSYDNVMFELDEAWNHLREEGVILIDNLDFTEAPYHFVKQKGVKLYKLSERAGGLGIIIKS